MEAAGASGGNQATNRSTTTKHLSSPRPLIARPLEWIVRHANAISLVCYVVAVIGILMFPVFARTTHVSENALMPATADPQFSEVDANYALTVADKLRQLVDSSSHKHKTLQDWLLDRLSGLGADTYLQPFQPPEKHLGSRFEWSSRRQERQAGINENKTGSSASSCGACGVGSSCSPQLQSCSDTGLHENAAGVTVTGRKGVGVNVVGIVRAPQGEGNEAMVLVTPFNITEGRGAGGSDGGLSEADALGLGVGVALVKVFSEVLWLAKDFVWIAADAAYGAHYPVDQWLKEYHSSAVKYAVDGQFNGSSMGFKRAGVISAGLVMEVDKKFSSGALNRVQILTEGGNGKMPNQDLINTAHFTSVWREGVRFELDKQEEVEQSAVAAFIGSVLETVTKTIRAGLTIITGQDGGDGMDDRKEHRLHAFLKTIPSVTTEGYVEGLATLAKFMRNQALGIPTGAHGAFGNYVIDAMTLRAMAANQQTIVRSGPTAARQRRIEQAESVRKIGRLLESVLRCVNNLLEKFHHSYFLYLLSAHDKFISIGDYMILFGLLIITLPLKAALLCVYGDDGHTKERSPQNEQNRGDVVDTNGAVVRQDQERDKASLTSGSGESAVVTSLSSIQQHGESSHEQRIMSNPPVPGLDDNGESDCGCWIRALALVAFIHLWSTLLALVPFGLVPLVQFMNQVDLPTGPALLAAVWGVSGGVLLWLTVWMATAFCSGTGEGGEMGKLSAGEEKGAGQSLSCSYMVWKEKDWMAIKSVMLGVMTIAFAAVSAINFALALALAILYVPMCHLSQPIFRRRSSVEKQKRVAVKVSSGESPSEHCSKGVVNLAVFLKHIMRRSIIMLVASLRVGCALFASPPLIFSCLFCYEVFIKGNDFAIMWNRLGEHLWWETALYPCIMLVCVPCNIICLLILCWS